MFKASLVIHRLVQEKYGIPLVDAGASLVPSPAEQRCRRRVCYALVLCCWRILGAAAARGSLQEADVDDAAAMTLRCWPGTPLADPRTIEALVLANGFAAVEVGPAPASSCHRLQHPACTKGCTSAYGAGNCCSLMPKAVTAWTLDVRCKRFCNMNAHNLQRGNHGATGDSYTRGTHDDGRGVAGGVRHENVGHKH